MPFLFAWIAAFGFGMETILGKLTSKYSLSDAWVFNFTYPLVIFLVTVPLALFNHAGIPTHWLDITLAGLFQALAFIFFVLALFKLDVSIFSPLFNFRSIFSVLIGVLFLGEVLTRSQYLLVGLIFIAGIFSSMDEKFSFRSFFTRPVALMILDTVFWSLSSLFINRAAAVETYWTISLWVAVTCQIFLLFTFPLFYKKLKKTKPKDYLGVVIMALAGVIGTLASIKAVSTNVGISTVIMSLPMSMIIAFALSFISPKLLEKHSFKVYLVRFVAAGVMIFAAFQLSQ